MKSLLHFLCILFLFTGISHWAKAQSTTIVSTGSFVGNGTANLDNGFCFSVRNNKPVAIKITDISCLHFGNGSGSASYSLWYTTAPGQVNANSIQTSGPDWTLYGVSPLQSPPDNVRPFFTNIALVVPANTTMRIAMKWPQTAPNTFVNTGVTLTGGPIFSAGGVDLMSGANTSGSNGLWGAANPVATLQTAWNFLGSITFEELGFPCEDTLDSVKVLAPAYVCSGRPFNISAGLLPSNLIITGATHQWQYSEDGTTWSNYTGAVNSAAGGLITDAITAPRWYRCAVTCANTGLTVNTPPRKVDLYPFYYCYCMNSVQDKNGGDIGNVTIMANNKLDTVLKKSSLQTGTGLPVFSNGGANRLYTAYHDSLAWPCLYRDSTYVFHVSQIFSANNYETGILHAYIDYDRDGIYNPTNERIFVKKYDATATKAEILQFSARISADTNISKLGPTGLRFILSKDSVYVPCGDLPGKGEVEDYIVKICPPPCNGPVAGGIVVSTDSSMCKSYEYTVTDTTYPKDLSAFDRAWQMSGDNITWLNVMNSGNKDTLNRVFTGQRIYYRLRTICQPTRDTSYSPATLVNEKAKYKCYCYSKATGGPVFDTSDIGGVAIATYSNNSGGPHVLNPGAYYPRTDRTEEAPIELFTDSLYRFNVYHTMPVIEHADAKVTIFMDFNNNHEYDIPTERVYSGYTSIGNHTVVEYVFVPYHTVPDVPTGMRIILNNNVGENIPSDEACGPYISGETEDYMVIFRKKWRAGISEPGVVNGYKIYPNPANGKFYVQFSTDSEVADVKVKVSSVTGQLVKEVSYRHEGGMFYQEVDMSGNTAGVYFVELQVGGKKQIQKLMLQ